MYVCMYVGILKPKKKNDNSDLSTEVSIQI